MELTSGTDIRQELLLVKHHTLGKTVHCDRLLVVSKGWEAAAAITPETPAARVTALGDNGPTSLSLLKKHLVS